MGIVESALAGAAQLAEKAIDAAGDMAEGATDVAAGTATAVWNEYMRVYEAYRASGLSPDDAADAAERYMRDVYGITVI